MNGFIKRRLFIMLLPALIILVLSLSSCAGGADADIQGDQSEYDTSDYIVSIWDEPDNVDFQCTTIYYNIAYNVFDRLVTMDPDENGVTSTQPSLAESWEVSSDGRKYTFHLADNIKFSNGSPLTSSDVQYTFERLLTHPDSCNKDIAESILGAGALESGSADSLIGFYIIDDQNFSITLEEPFEAFLACLTMPGASILDEETTEEAGDRFGTDPEYIIGTGSYILDEWVPGKGMLLSANKDCWAGPPENSGLDVRFINDSQTARAMFDDGELDVIDLDDLDNSAEFYIHGDIYKDRLYEAQQMGTSYIALNESVEPLGDVRVRKALQLALNRDILLDSVYGGRGTVENGIYPHGLYGFNPDIPVIPHDQEEAAALLREAGYPDGFDLTFNVKSTSTQNEMELAKMAASMWNEIGVRAKVEVISENEFMSLRKSGKLPCYTATWIADYNDPDNFVYTFFGNKANTAYRSLCYTNEDNMRRVRKARTITDPERRIQEYQDIEICIAQDDAAWIPLFSRKKYYVTSERLKGFKVAWTGRFFKNYRYMSVDDAE